MRRVQRITGCATTTLNLMLQHLQPHLKINEQVRVHHADELMFKNGGAKILRLNGCVHCHTHVYLPTSELIMCPKCHGPRFNQRGQPNESCWYFPIRDQLRALLKSPKYRDLYIDAWVTQKAKFYRHEWCIRLTEVAWNRGTSNNESWTHRPTILCGRDTSTQSQRVWLRKTHTINDTKPAALVEISSQ